MTENQENVPSVPMFLIPFNIRYDETEFGFDRATDEVPWEQLPEQIKKHMQGFHTNAPHY
jgi:hypothetical protein